MDLDLSLAASFLVLAEEGHYGRAAARLHMTSSALSKRIQRLERQLGVTVIDRGPAGVLRVTTAGRRFADAAGPLLTHAATVRETARTRPDRYTVRIGFPAGTLPSLSALGLDSVIRDVRRSYPEARFVGREIAFTELTRCLPDQYVDVLWTNSSVRHMAVESHRTQVSTELIGVVAARHRLAEAEIVAFQRARRTRPALAGPVPQAVDEAQPGPDGVDRAHLVVDEPGRETERADLALPDVGEHARGALGPRDPQPARRVERGGERGQPALELGAAREEGHDHVERLAAQAAADPHAGR